MPIKPGGQSQENLNVVREEGVSFFPSVLTYFQKGVKIPF